MREERWKEEKTKSRREATKRRKKKKSTRKEPWRLPLFPNARSRARGDFLLYRNEE